MGLRIANMMSIVTIVYSTVECDSFYSSLNFNSYFQID